MSAAELHNPALGPSAAIHNKNVPPYDIVSCDVAIFNNIMEDGTHGGNSVCCIYVEVVIRLVSDRKISKNQCSWGVSSNSRSCCAREQMFQECAVRRSSLWPTGPLSWLPWDGPWGYVTSW